MNECEPRFLRESPVTWHVSYPGRLSGRSSRSLRAARSPDSPTDNSWSGSSDGAIAAGEAAFAALVSRHGPMVLHRLPAVPG